MSLATALALGLALLSTTLTNLAYVRQHDAAARLPVLSLRHPLRAVRLLVTDRAWMRGFALEGGGFACYAAALALGTLALVQSVVAGGIGILAFVSARAAHRALGRVELAGVAVSVLGLVARGVSLAGGSTEGGGGSTVWILVWIAGTAALAGVALRIGTRVCGRAIACAVAGGLMFSIGDISTKLVTDGGARVVFLLTLVGGYLLGTGLLQSGYQAGRALTVAGVATLLTNALPIVAGVALLGESVPAGALGVLRGFAFAAVIVGAVLLSRAPGGDEVGAGGSVAAGGRGGSG